MLNLILKDYKANKVYIIFLLLGCLIFAWMVLSVKPEIYVYQCSQFMLMQVIVLLCYEKMKAKEYLYCSLPVNRKYIVVSRYLVTLLTFFIGMLIFIILIEPLNLLIFEGTLKISEIMDFGNLFSSLFTFLIIVSVSFPMFFRFGIAKGITLSALLFILVFFVIPLSLPDSILNIYEIIDKIEKPSEDLNLPMFYGGLSLFIVTAAAVSINVSTNFYKKHEL